jgi:hypothetical protein
MTLVDEAIKTLRRAREILFEQGWYQGDLHGPDKESCLIGAIERARRIRLAEFDFEEAPVRKELEASLKPEVLAFFEDNEEGLYAIAAWNDAPGRTFDEVIDLIDLTIKRLEQP